MNEKEVYVSLDVGTTKVCTTVACLNGESNLEIIGVGTYPSYGLRKGSVVNIDKTINSIRNSVEEARVMAGLSEITHATVGIAGNHIYCFNSSGVVAVKGKEITNEDVERVVEAAKAVLIPKIEKFFMLFHKNFESIIQRELRNPSWNVWIKVGGSCSYCDR
jgi:cell division protein FtsA